MGAVRSNQTDFAQIREILVGYLPEETAIDALNGTFRMNGNRLCVAFVTHFYPSAAEQQRGLAIHQMVQSLSAMADIEVFCVSPVYPKVDFLSSMQPTQYESI